MKNQENIKTVTLQLTRKANSKLNQVNNDLVVSAVNASRFIFKLKNGREVEFNEMVSRGHFMSVEQIKSEITPQVEQLKSEGHNVTVDLLLHNVTISFKDIVAEVCEKMMSDVTSVRLMNEKFSLPSMYNLNLWWSEKA